MARKDPLIDDLMKLTQIIAGLIQVIFDVIQNQSSPVEPVPDPKPSPAPEPAPIPDYEPVPDSEPEPTPDPVVRNWMKASMKCRESLKKLEGFRLAAYGDQGGTWTIGWGHTGSGITKGLTISLEQAEAFFRLDVARAEGVVNRLVRVRLLQREFDALVSFVFNIGEPKFAKSTLLKILNQGGRLEAAKEFLRWDKVRSGDKHVICADLTKRRVFEKGVFLSGYHN